jgi:integrase
MNRVSEFMLQLSKDLIEQKKITESSASLYINHLWTLNNKQPFNNLSFLKNTNAIDELLKKYKDNSKKTMLSAIVSILSLYKDKPSYKKVYDHYYNLMMNKATEMKETNINEKSKTQDVNWITWDEVLTAKKTIKEIVDSFSNQKLITPQQFEILLAYVVLSLYTDIPPRRNQDYIDMYFVPNLKDIKTDENVNYLDWTNKKLVFNHYKTSKKYGQQNIEIGNNQELIEAITKYLKYHPLNPSPSLKKIPKNTHFKFLVYSDGSPLTAVNAITRILNKIFNKKIGSSMLRHIYLSSKYDISSMKNDATMMGHSLNEQRQYLKEPMTDIHTEDYESPSDTDTSIEPKTPKPKEAKNKNKFKLTTI